MRNHTFRTTAQTEMKAPDDDIQLAAGGVFLEMAHADREFAYSEARTILRLMQRCFLIDKKTALARLFAANMLRRAGRTLKESSRPIRKKLNAEERKNIFAMACSVAFADGVVRSEEQGVIEDLRKLFGLSDYQGRHALCLATVSSVVLEDLSGEDSPIRWSERNALNHRSLAVKSILRADGSPVLTVHRREVPTIPHQTPPVNRNTLTFIKDSVAAVLLGLAAADGIISISERLALRDVLRKLFLLDRSDSNRLIEQVRESILREGPEKVFARATQCLGVYYNRRQREMILKHAFEIASVDGVFTSEEHRFFDNLQAALADGRNGEPNLPGADTFSGEEVRSFQVG